MPVAPSEALEARGSIQEQLKEALEDEKIRRKILHTQVASGRKESWTQKARRQMDKLQREQAERRQRQDQERQDRYDKRVAQQNEKEQHFLPPERMIETGRDRQ